MKRRHAQCVLQLNGVRAQYLSNTQCLSNMQDLNDRQALNCVRYLWRYLNRAQYLNGVLYLILFFLLLIPVVCVSALSPSLTVVRVPLSNTVAPRHRQRQAMQTAFKRVLVRLTGNTGITTLPFVTTALPHVRRWIDSYQRIKTNSSTPLLEVTFDRQGLLKLLQRYGQSVWSSQGPQVSTWIVLPASVTFTQQNKKTPTILLSQKNKGTPTTLLSHQNKGISTAILSQQGQVLSQHDKAAPSYQQIVQQFWDRGIGVRFPMAALTVQSILPLQHLVQQQYRDRPSEGGWRYRSSGNDWQFDLNNIRTLVQTHHLPVFWVGWVTPKSVRSPYIGHWLLWLQGQSFEWQTQGNTVNHVLTLAINQITTMLVQSNGVLEDNQLSSRVALQISHIDSLMAYATCLARLRRLDAVKQATLGEVNTDTIDVTLNITDNATQLLQQLQADRHFQQLSADHYAWLNTPEL